MNVPDIHLLLAVGVAYALAAGLMREARSKKTVLSGASLICWGLAFGLLCARGEGGPLGLLQAIVAVATGAPGMFMFGYGVDRIRHPYRYSRGW